MFFFFSKVLVFLLSPFLWMFLLLVFALFTKQSNRKRNYLIVSILILLLFSNGFLFNEAVRKWEVPVTRIEALDKYDYAILLGGFSSFDTTYKKIRFGEAADRFCQTIQLYHQKKVKKIFISGGAGSLLHQENTEADKVKAFMLSIHIPEQDIVMEMTSRNTHENAVNTAAYLGKHAPGARCLLVTSACHMPRALGCFKKAGSNVTPYVTDYLAQPRKYEVDLLILPNPNILYRWSLLLKEWVGYLSYKVSGYI
jgi:uncharacterized SAM-binding protein YcdF (DUF218 family)